MYSIYLSIPSTFQYIPYFPKKHQSRFHVLVTNIRNHDFLQNHYYHHYNRHHRRRRRHHHHQYIKPQNHQQIMSHTFIWKDM